MLHKSEYYKADIVKYFNCKKCERVRLAKVRDAARYVTVDDSCCYCWSKCRVAIDMENVYDLVGEGGFSYYNCRCNTPCHLRHKKTPDVKTGLTYYPAQTKCEWCRNYTCTATNPALCRKEIQMATIKKVVKKTIPPPKEDGKVPPLTLKLYKKWTWQYFYVL